MSDQLSIVGLVYPFGDLLEQSILPHEPNLIAFFEKQERFLYDLTERIITAGFDL